MSQILKIKVVIGSHRDSSMLAMWEEISTVHQVELLALEGGEDGLRTNLPVIMFPNIPDMPGFMRDLDRFILGADIVVAIESSRLFSFQALRAARKLGIKFCAVVHEYSPFVYERYANIRAIQHDIYENADKFFATSRRAEQLLQMEGVSGGRVTRLPVSVKGSEFAFSELKREKFRKYVGIPSEATLLTIKTSLEDLEPALSVIQGVRLCMNRLSASDRANIRFLVCGDGKAHVKLKYEASDMGLGPQALFLAQDTTPFLSDLLSATDVLIEGRWMHKRDPEPLPWHVLGAACSGTQIIVPRGAIADEWLSGVEVHKVDDSTPMDLAFTLFDVVTNLPSAEARVLSASQSSLRLTPALPSAVIVRSLVEDCQHDEKITRRQGLSHFIKAHQVPVTYKDARDVLLKCEELRDFASTCEVENYSEILRIRGDALVALSRADEAIQSFEQSLKVHQTNFQALRGLGYLAWHGYSHEDALSFFKRGLAVNPNDYQCLMGVGLVYRRLKMFEESVFWLQKAVAVGGPESPSMSILVQACLENPESAGALEVLHSLRESMGDHPNLMTAIDKLESHQ